MNYWFAAYTILTLVCAAWWVRELVRSNYSISVGQLVMILLVSAVPLVSVLVMIYAASLYAFWGHILWSKKHAQN